MNIYYLRELRKAAYHKYKILKLGQGGYRIVCRNASDYVNDHYWVAGADTLEDATRKLKEARTEHIRKMLLDLQNEKLTKLKKRNNI